MVNVCNGCLLVGKQMLGCKVNVDIRPLNFVMFTVITLRSSFILFQLIL